MEANRLLHRRENGTIWIANFCYSHLFPLIFSRVTCNLDYLSIYSCNAFLLVIAPWKPVNKILSSLLYSWSNQIVKKKRKIMTRFHYWMFFCHYLPSISLNICLFKYGTNLTISHYAFTTKLESLKWNKFQHIL